MAEKKEKRFIKTYSQGGGFSNPAMEILVDKETGVNYVYASYGYSGGITPLLNRDGTPVITPVPNKYEE
ncbi:MAG: xylan 1,4-beta-xylosidase [Oscillospiraceae bacterium]|nr:xylan 1,4-beta-xylosidase [Oscillospiraceae bacterium]